MFIKVLKSKIHRATVTEANVNYTGSIGIDGDLCDAVGLVPGEIVLIADINNGERLETYVQREERGSGTICMNGAAARLINVGDLIIIMSSGYFAPEELKDHKPRIVVVDEQNKVVKTL